MTLIVYRDGELVADRLVVTKNHLPKNFLRDIETEEDKIVVTEDNQFAYVFNNDQIPNVIDALLIKIRRFELNLIPADEPELKFETEFKVLIMTKRNAYSVVNKEDELIIRVLNNDVYIAPDGAYRHYEALSLTAVEIFEVLRVQGQFMIGVDYTLVKQRSLRLIRKEKK